MANNRLFDDIVQWDIANWKRAIEFWNESIDINDIQGKKILELGANKGGLSLYFALNGSEVVCSDYIPETIDEEEYWKEAKKLHKKYGVDKRITYRNIDACKINQKEMFDIITFKSVCGAVGRNGNISNQKEMFAGIYQALKSGGCLLFCDNLSGTKLHRMMRSKFSKAYKNGWEYLNYNKFDSLLDEFFIQYKSFGLFACFIKNKYLNKFFGKIDKFLEHLTVPEKRYIVSCIAYKDKPKFR